MQSRPFHLRDPDRPEPGIRGTPRLRDVRGEMHRAFRGMCCPIARIIARRCVFSSSMQARAGCLPARLPLIPKARTLFFAGYKDALYRMTSMSKRRITLSVMLGLCVTANLNADIAVAQYGAQPLSPERCSIFCRSSSEYCRRLAHREAEGMQRNGVRAEAFLELKMQECNKQDGRCFAGCRAAR